MKKMILILILVIPVMIALVISLLAGFVAREITFVDIQKVEITKDFHVLENAFWKHGSIITWEDDEHSTYEVEQVFIGEDIDLKEFIRLTPSKAKFAYLQCNYKIGTLTVKKEESPIIIDKYGYLHAVKASSEQVTIDVMVSGQRQLTFIIKLVVD